MLIEVREKFKIIFKTQEFNSTIWNVADVIFLPFIMLLLTPLFIKLLGTEQYGLWMLVNSILVSIGLVNFGIGDASIRFISKYRAFSDYDNIFRVINSSLTVSIVLSLLIISIGNILAFFLASYNILNIETKYLSVTIISIRIASFLFGLKLIEQFLLSVFKGFEQYNIAARISILSKSLLLLGQAGAVIFTRSLENIFIVSVLIGIVIVIFEVIYVKYKNKGIYLKPRINKRSFKELFSYGSWAWIQSILGVAFGQADRFVVMSLTGPKMLAYYSLATTIAYQIHGVFTTGVSWIFPKVSRKTERNENISKLYYKTQLFIIISEFLLMLFLIKFQKYIFLTWLGYETYSQSIQFIELFLVFTFFTSLSIVPYFFFLGSNLIKYSALFMFVSVIMSLIFMIIGYKFTGVPGFAYGKVLSSIITVPIMLFFLHAKVIDRAKTNGAVYITLLVLLLSATFYANIFIVLPLFLISIFLVKKIYVKYVVHENHAVV